VPAPPGEHGDEERRHELHRVGQRLQSPGASLGEAVRLRIVGIQVSPA
jgi:hypothetical protein